MKKITDSIINQIKALYASGNSLGAIARLLEISKGTVSKYINEANLSRYTTPVEVTDSLLETMQSDYNSGMSKRDISRKYKVSFSRLEKLVKPMAQKGYEVLKNRRHRIKEELIRYKGGKCEICGYSRCQSALEFHHRDPKEKDFGIATNSSYKNMGLLKKEIDKCILVCANCHREIHSGIISI